MDRLSVKDSQTGNVTHIEPEQLAGLDDFTAGRGLHPGKPASGWERRLGVIAIHARPRRDRVGPSALRGPAPVRPLQTRKNDRPEPALKGGPSSFARPRRPRNIYGSRRHLYRARTEGQILRLLKTVPGCDRGTSPIHAQRTYQVLCRATPSRPAAFLRSGSDRPGSSSDWPDIGDLHSADQSPSSPFA